MAKHAGNITIVGNANVWQHEMDAARALVRDRHDVEFIDRGGRGDGCVDVRMDGLIWEMRSPKSDKMATAQKNMRRAFHQSPLRDDVTVTVAESGGAEHPQKAASVVRFSCKRNTPRLRRRETVPLLHAGHAQTFESGHGLAPLTASAALLHSTG